MIETLAFLAVIINRLTEILIKPIFERQNWDNFYIVYVTWILGFMLVMLTGIDAFDGLFKFAVVGPILTALIAGGGSNLIYELLKRE
jgi:hypothetical protein